MSIGSIVETNASLVFLILVVYSLAVARVTGLIVLDTITEPIRDRIVVWLDDAPGSLGEWLAKLITCPWCAGMWVSLAAAPIVWWWATVPAVFVVALALAFSQVAGMIAGIGRD